MNPTHYHGMALRHKGTSLLNTSMVILFMIYKTPVKIYTKT